MQTIDDFLDKPNHIAISCCGKKWDDIVQELTHRGYHRNGYEQIPLDEALNTNQNTAIIFDLYNKKEIVVAGLDTLKFVGYKIFAPSQILLSKELPNVPDMTDLL